MTKVVNRRSDRSQGKLTPVDEKKLTTGILILISQFFAEGRNLTVGDRSYVVMSSDEEQPETESFIDVVRGVDDPGRVISRYAVILQKISR